MTNENKTELKPCPLCKSRRVWAEEPELEGQVNGVIYCKCGIRMEGAFDYILKAWNTRPNASEGVNVEALVEECEGIMISERQKVGMIYSDTARIVVNKILSKTQTDPRIKEAVEICEESYRFMNELNQIWPLTEFRTHIDKIKTTLEAG